jgi:hypothetical protein
MLVSSAFLGLGRGPPSIQASILSFNVDYDGFASGLVPLKNKMSGGAFVLLFASSN